MKLRLFCMEKQSWEKHKQYYLSIRFKLSSKPRITSEGCYKCQCQTHRNEGLKVKVGQADRVHRNWKWWQKDVEGQPHTDCILSTSLLQLFIFSQLLTLTKGQRKNISFSKMIFSFPFV